MKPAHSIVLRRQGQRFAEYPVNRTVVRIGTDPNSDVVLEGGDMPPTALTINFGDQRRIVCYARAAVFESIAGQPVQLNQGLPLPLQAEVLFTNGLSLTIELTKEKSLGDGGEAGAVDPSGVRSAKASPGSIPASEKKLTPVAGPVTEVSKRAGRKYLLPLAVLASLGLLLAVIAILAQKKSVSGVLPAKSPSGQPALSYFSVANQLFGLSDEELALRPELKAVLGQLQLSQKYRNNNAKSREHLELARDLLRRQLGDEIFTNTSLPDYLQPKFDRTSELQLYQEICKMLQ